MKIYLPGYYLRSLRNQPLIEIDAEEVNTTIQVHQCEVQKTRTNRNLKVFEELSRSNRAIKNVADKMIRAGPVIVPPLVQEFIRDTSKEVSSQSTHFEDFSLTQALNKISEVNMSDNFKHNIDFQQQKFDSIPNTCTLSSTSVTLGCQRIRTTQAPYSSNIFMSVPKPTVFYQGTLPASESHLPKKFKAKLRKNLRDSIMKSPNFNVVRMKGLSYSQPSTPKTPMDRSLLCGTPRLQKRINISTPSLNQYMPFTPMLHEAVKLLDRIPERCEENIDLLNIIDDDTKPVEMVDKELDLYSEVNDANVADYVLNIANDYPVQYETSTFQKVSNIEPNQRRKCHRAKPVFLEESEAFKEQKRQKDRERRKKRKLMFDNKSPLGTRRSKYFVYQQFMSLNQPVY